MHERARRCGGGLHIVGNEGGGTTVALKVPLKKPYALTEA